MRVMKRELEKVFARIDRHRAKDLNSILIPVKLIGKDYIPKFMSKVMSRDGMRKDTNS